MTIKQKITLFLSILFISVIGNAFLTYKLEQYSQDKAKWVKHTNEVITHMREYLSGMQDSETAQRGYLLTKNTIYLEPYHYGSLKVEEHYNELLKLTLDKPNQILLTEMKKLKIRKFNELQITIQLTNDGKFTEALSIVNKNSGKLIMDSLRKKSTKFLNKELQILNQHENEFIELRTRIVTLIAISVTFFTMLALFTMLFLNRTLFEPISLLLNSTKKVEKGEQIDIGDITTQDEMGYLLSSFYKMNEKVVKREACLTHKVSHDELTKLLNRESLYSSIDSAIESSKENNSKVAILFLDLNKFKMINDTLGHKAGDFLLIEASKVFTKSLRNSDKVFRIGGDEFLILLENITDISQVDTVIHKIFNTLKTPVVYQGKELIISTSIGIAIFPEDGKSPDELVKASDIAMYTAKKEIDLSYKYFDVSMLKRKSDKDEKKEI